MDATQPQPVVTDKSSSSDWLWNALDIDSSALQFDVSNPIDLMGPNELLEDEWFWAVNEELPLPREEIDALSQLAEYAGDQEKME